MTVPRLFRQMKLLFLKWLITNGKWLKKSTPGINIVIITKGKSTNQESLALFISNNKRGSGWSPFCLSYMKDCSQWNLIRSVHRNICQYPPACRFKTVNSSALRAANLCIVDDLLAFVPQLFFTYSALQFLEFVIDVLLFAFQDFHVVISPNDFISVSFCLDFLLYINYRGGVKYVQSFDWKNIVLYLLN